MIRRTETYPIENANYIGPSTESWITEHEENVKHFIDVNHQLQSLWCFSFIIYYYHRSLVFIHMKEYMIIMISDQFWVDSFSFKRQIYTLYMFRWFKNKTLSNSTGCVHKGNKIIFERRMKYVSNIVHNFKLFPHIFSYTYI